MKRLHARQGRGFGGLLVTSTAAVSLVGISRTIGYVLVVGSLAVVWVGTVTLLTSVMPAESPLAVAASTLAAAALFNPLRSRVQDWGAVVGTMQPASVAVWVKGGT